MSTDTDPTAISDVPSQMPWLAVAVSAVVATIVYLAIQLIIEGQIDVVETAAFVVIFTGVYAAFLYLRRKVRS